MSRMFEKDIESEPEKKSKKKLPPQNYGEFMYVYLKKGFFFGLEREFSLLTPWSNFYKKDVPFNDKARLMFLKTLNFLV